VEADIAAAVVVADGENAGSHIKLLTEF
jgi:hypothetical protein